MEKIDKVLAEMCDVVEDLPTYDHTDQYAEPFGCETARPGNYFKNAGLTEVFRAAFLTDTFAETLAQVSYDMIDQTDGISWANDESNRKRQIIGTARMLLRRWARGGRGEALCMIEYGYVEEIEALKIVAEKTGNFYNNSRDMDENGKIDFVTPDEKLVQVKTTKRKPSYKTNADYDLLLWVTPEYDIVEIEE